MFTTYRRIFDLLDARERRRFGLLMLLVLVMGFLDMVGVASILPFLAVLSNPDIVNEHPLLNSVFNFFEFTDTPRFLIFLGFATLSLFLFAQLFKAGTFYTITRFGTMRGHSISQRLLESYLRQPYPWFLNRHTADLGSLVLGEVTGVVNGAILPSLRLVAYATVSLFLFAILLISNPIAALVGALVVGGTYAAIFSRSRRYLSRIGKERVIANQARFRVAQEALGGIKDVKLLGLESAYTARFTPPSRRFARYVAIANIMNELPRYLIEALIFGLILAFVLFLLMTSDGRLEQIIPILGVYAFAGARMFPAMQHVYRSLATIRFTRPALDRLHQDFMAKTRTLERSTMDATSREPLQVKRRIEFADVHYRYPAAERVAVAGLNLEIEANTTVGLVGTTGAGKTTAIDLLLGLLEPESGHIVVDGVAIDAGNRRAWQRNVGYVPQQIYLVDDTIAGNIALGVHDAEIDLEAVERAARLANLHDFVVKELPEGYRTMVGERGVRLSGGQRQRIGIARALYFDPAVLVLDEATSALDNWTEKAVMDAVHGLARAKTIIMVAHRVSTIEDCDTIYVLHQGRCVAQGTYEDLLNRSAAFRQIAQPQKEVPALS